MEAKRKGPNNIWDKRAVLQEAERILHPNEKPNPFIEKLYSFKDTLYAGDSLVVGGLIYAAELLAEPIAYAKTLHQHNQTEKAGLALIIATLVPLTVASLSSLDKNPLWGSIAFGVIAAGIQGIVFSNLRSNFLYRHRNQDKQI